MPQLTDPELLPWLARMRVETPLWVDESGARHVFRHADVQAILADPRRFSSDFGRAMPFLGADKLSVSLMWLDPPAHRPLRQLVSRAFTPATIQGLRGRIEDTARELVSAMPEGEFDIAEALAYPLPIIVIAELLGVSPADWAFFRDCADRAFALRVEPGVPQDELAAMVTAATKDLDYYLADLVRQRRARPADDLLTVLISGEVDGARLNDAQVSAFASALLTAGYVTTTLLIGNALLCLRDHPAVADRLRADRSLIPAAIEEVLRMRPPIPHARRLTTEEVVIAGELVPANALVTLSVLSAHHDERQFTDPESFEPTRDAGRHLAFGHGIHFCLGAPLARLETEIALNLLFDEFAELRIGSDIVSHESEFYGPKRLPVSGMRGPVR
ncbi:MAG TPA: cytochrome P450 [Pseudonocardiaceae bacterium]